jgi:hypothetical protein
MLLPQLKHDANAAEYDTWQESHRREHTRLVQLTAGFPLTPRSVATIGASALVAPTYGATNTIDVSLGTDFNLIVTDGNAFTVSNPINAVSGQHLFITIKNTSGGALGAVTWSSAYKLSAWTSPANGFSRSIEYRYDGTNFIELARTAADIPN